MMYPNFETQLTPTISLTAFLAFPKQGPTKVLSTNTFTILYSCCTTLQYLNTLGLSHTWKTRPVSPMAMLSSTLKLQV